MRLRLAPVEYKECVTAHCSTKYEGSHCPTCQQPFDPRRIRKALHDRLILVDVDPSVYEQTHRCRCSECKNLFDLSEPDVVAGAKCSACGEPLFSKVQIQEMWKEAETLLQRARRLDRARRQIRACPHCAHPVPLMSWCPLHNPTSQLGATGGLPQNPIVVWVRTFQTAESLEELQGREWLQKYEADEEWMLDETETATAIEEINHHAQE
jgi:hypothetical protein